MALDFPASPTDGQQFNAPNGVMYVWNAAGGLWLAQGGSTSSATISATPPANPFIGQLWWSPDLGRLFIFYFDGNSSQWVPASPTTAGGTAPGDFFATYTGTIPAAAQTIVFPTVVTGNSGGWYNPSNGRFTPPAGRYRISACLGGSMSTGSPGSQVCTLRKNGTALVTGSGTVSGNFFWAEAIIDGEYDANGTDWFDIQNGGTAWDRTPALSWFTAQPVGGISYTTPTPGNQYLYSEQVLAAPATSLTVTMPANAKQCVLDFAAVVTGNTNSDLRIAAMISGAIDTSTNYQFAEVYTGSAAPTTASAFWTAAMTGWQLTSAGYQVVGEMRPQPGPSTTWYTACSYWLATAGNNVVVTGNGYGVPVGVPTGWRLFNNSGNTFITGSYLRCYVVQ